MQIKSREDQVSLLPEEGVFYTDLHMTDCERFVMVFNSVWRNLPAEVPDLLLSSWKTLKGFDQGSVPLIWCPHITYGFGGWQKHHTFEYHAPFVSFVPDDILGILIAHELAHAFSMERRWRDHPQDFGGNGGRLLTIEEIGANEEEWNELRRQEELKVRGMNCGWSFDETRLDAWIDKWNASQAAAETATANE